MHDERDDREFEKYLAGESAESRRYAELGDDMPPANLDARILAEAENAIEVTPLESRRAPPFKAFAWAAIVVLSFSLVLNIVFQQAMQDPIADLETTDDRYDAPAALPEWKDDADVAAKRERAQPQAPMIASPPVEGLAAGKPSQPAESREIAQQLLREASEPAGADTLLFDESSTAMGKAATAEPAGVRAQVKPPAGPAGELTWQRDEVIQVLAEYLAGEAGTGRADAAANRAPGGDDADAELRRILDLYDDGAAGEAMAALAAFRDTHPNHPVSRTLTERDIR